MSRIKVGVIGCGHLGAIHARLLAARSDVELVGVVDPSPESRTRVAEAHGCRGFEQPRDLVGAVQAAVVAAPTGLHAAVSLPLLEGGIDLLVEKPLAATVEDARAIVIAARRHGRVVAVGHVERFNPAWRMAVERAGRVVAIQAARQAPFTFRSMDVGAVLDLMIHDIDLVLSLEPGRLEEVEAHGLLATGGHEDMVRARLRFSSGLVADLVASRIHPTLHRTISVVSTDSVIDVDFNAKTVTVMTPSAGVRDGSYVATDVPVEHRAVAKEAFFTDVLPRETLTAPDANAIACEHDDFLAAVTTGRAPLVPASAGAAALEIAGRVLDALACTRFGCIGEPAVVPLGSRQQQPQPAFPRRKTG
jgi:predicted dehydrogenase